MPDQRFILELETLIKLSTGDAIKQVEGLFAALRAEGERAIQASASTGSQAGLSHLPGLYTAAIGATSAYALNKPGITPAEQLSLRNAMAGAEDSYKGLQSSASEYELSLRNLTSLDRAHQSGSRLLNEALERQSRELELSRIATSERVGAEKVLTDVEKKVALTEEERVARLAEARGGSVAGRAPQREPLVAPPIPLPGTRYGIDLEAQAKARKDLELKRSGPPLSEAQVAVAEEQRALQLKADIAREQATSKEYLAAKAESTLAERQRAAAVARSTRELAVAQGLGEGTFFQRLQATVHARGGFGGFGGGGGDNRLPSDYQSFGQFLTSKALTTGGFALSGAVLYGAISGFRQITQEASALQRELAIVKGEFEKVGDTQGFQNFAKQVTQISVETGIAADQVALVARQLAGVFRDPTTGAADFTKALNETNTALKLSQVTGLPFQEITDSLTAITTSLGSSFTTIGDLAIGLEQRFGVLAPQIIAFTADVAPVAKALGFTVEQISALGAIAQQRSGVSGSALAESFNRALPAIQQAGVKIAEIFNQRPSTAQFTTPVLSALGSGQGAVAIQELSRAYAVMTQNQRQALAELLGGPRAAKAFFAVLEAGTDTIDALNGKTGQYAGSLNQRFTDFQQTVSFAFERARRSLEAFGLALFNSGLADGLKLIADTGSEVAKVAAELLSIFSTFNDVLGGLPIKLLAVYTTLRLLSSLGGGLGGLGALISGVRGGVPAAGAAGASPLAGLGFISATPAAATAAESGLPYATTGLFGRSVAASSTQTALAGVAKSLAPAVAALAVAQVLQTVENVRQQTDSAIKSFDSKVSELFKQGVNPDEIVRRIKSAGGGASTGTLGQLINFGQETNPTTEGINQLQRENAAQQAKELGVIIKGADKAQREQIAKFLLDQPEFATQIQNILQSAPNAAYEPDLAKRLSQPGQLELAVKQFQDNPTVDILNDAFARLIAKMRLGGASPEVVKQLLDLYDQYQQKAAASADLAKANDYAPLLEEVRARYESGNASLDELLTADRAQLANFKQVLDTAGDNQQARLEAAKGLAAQQKQIDSDITSAAQRAADVTIKLAGLTGGDVAKTTTQARLQQLQTIIAQGGSPAAVLDAALSALDAQQQELEQFINSPVIQNGIARAPTADEKLARATKGSTIPAQVREAIIRGSLGSTASFEAVKAAADANGTTMSALIDTVTTALLNGDKQEIDTLTHAIDAQIEQLQNFAKLGTFLGGAINKAAVDKSIAALNAAKSLLTSVDPGSHVSGSGIVGLIGQSAIEASSEAKAYAEALIAQQRARAHGDPVAEAQASIASAKVALQNASKPSERAAAIAQLIDGQNQLDDAQNAIIDARISSVATLLERGGDPVGAARQRVQLALRKVAEAKGTAAQIAAQDELLAAQQGVNDAIVKVFDAQAQLVSAIAAAAGDTVAVAKEALAVAQKHLADLAAAGRTDPKSDPEVAAALAAVATTEAGVRDAELNKRTQDIDIALQLEKITTAQAIAQFEALLQIPKLTTDETNAILIKIKSLKDSLSQDFANNIPSEIKLPTLYEVRRLNGVGTPGGPQSYQDNRQIQINLQAYNQGDLTAAVDTIVGVLDSRPRNGNRAGAYP